MSLRDQTFIALSARCFIVVSAFVFSADFYFISFPFIIIFCFVSCKVRLLAKSLIQGCILSFSWTFPHTLRLLVNTLHCSVLWKLLSCAVARPFYPLMMESGFISDLRSALSSSCDLKGQLLCCSLPGDCDY